MTDDLERRLRRALHDDASSITPTDRRRSIEAMVHDDAATPSGTRRWSGPVASAAAVAVIAALAWGATGALRPPGDRTTTAATTGTPDAATSATPSPAAPSTGPEPSAPVPAAPASPAVPTPAATATARSVPSATATSVPSATATSMPSAGSSAPRGAGTLALLPVYLVGPVGGDGTGQRYGLFRELVRAALPTGTTPAQKAQAALTVAMAATAGDAGTPYPRPWSGTTVSGVTVADGAITVALSDAGPSGLPAEQSRLAVQELVWTATAAVGNATFPVRFSVPGATALLGSYPTGAAYSRPAADATYQDLAPIWVESPSAGAVLPADRPVVVSGSASVFEATLQWRLTRSGTEVAKGVSTATIGAPARGTWTAGLGRLPAGTYTFTAWEISAEDGSVHAEDGTTFTVR